MPEDRIFEKIKLEIGNDFAAVKPVSQAWLRGLILLPAWLVLVVGVLLVFGLREDDFVLGVTNLWGFAIVQLMAAYILVLLGFRSLIPGESNPAIATLFWLSSAFIAHLGISFYFFRLHPVSPVQAWRAALVCLCFIVGLSVFPLLILRLMALRGIIQRAVEPGLLFGLGGALCVESVWRLHCPYTSPGHILTSHSLGLIVVASLAWAFAAAIRGREFREFLDRRPG